MTRTRTRKMEPLTRKRNASRVNRDVEPGINIPTANYPTVAQFCTKCGDVETHFKNSQKQKLLCENCGNIITFGMR